MITESELYWILKLDDIRSLLTGCTIVLSIISIVLAIMTIVQTYDVEPLFDDSDWRRSIFARLAVYITLIVFSVTLVLLPSTKQMAAIKGIPVIVNSDIAKDVPSDVKALYKLGVDALKEKLTDAHSNKE